jgi:glutaredoxin/glutathione-dependent peroxiredoxin
MQIKIGGIIPEFEVAAITAAGQEKLTTDQIFANKRVALFGVPGAFTPTCSDSHLPSYLSNLDALKAKGVDRVVCICVNDIHVVKAWAKHTGVDGKIDMLSDGNADVARALGLDVALNAFGMGTRNKRFSMIVENKVVKQLNVEEKSGVNVSGAETLLGQL